jgi:VWFA-related protein
MRWKSILILTSGALLLFASAVSLRSQFRTRVDLVIVPVSVRDNNGYLLTELERDDFKVFEDGRQQQISNFSKDTLPLSAAIVIDDAISGAALKQLVPLLPSAVGAFKPADEMTSFRYDHNVWRLLPDFTSDAATIRQSFFELKRIADSRPVEVEKPPALYEKIEKKTPDWLKAIAGLISIGSNGAPNPVPSAPAAPKPVPETRTMHGAVYEAAMALQKRPENHRRIILLISDGTVHERQTGVVPGKTLHSFEKNVELLLKSEIEVYSINTLGTLLEKAGGTLDSYARASGGDVYGGSSASDMEFAFKRIVEQARSQYVLGYLSNNTAPRVGIYRKIEVKSGDPDQKRKVTHRNGYLQFPIPQ